MEPDACQEKMKKRTRDELRVESNPIKNSGCLIGNFTHELCSVIRVICMVFIFPFCGSWVQWRVQETLSSDDHSAFLSQHLCLTFKNILRAASVCF